MDDELEKIKDELTKNTLELRKITNEMKNAREINNTIY